MESRYAKEKKRYCIKLLLDDGSKKMLSVKPENISLLPTKKSDIGSLIRGNDLFYYYGGWDIIHVLVPCLRSLVHQIGHCRIFVSLSGTAELRQLAMESLRFGAAIPEENIGRQHQWIVYDDDMDGSDYTKKSQFQHYKSLLSVSSVIKSSAWLMFLDNDDLYHPFRVRFFQDIIAMRATEENEVENYFFCGGKLLIDVAKANAKFGDGDYDIIEYQKFILLDDELNDLVDVAASARENDEKDVREYFDFCVKTKILQQFIDATPDDILSHQFCDVLFQASLSHPRIRHYEHPQQEWLLMHYRVRGYDRHQRFLDLDTDSYTNAMLKIEVSADDCLLGEDTGLKAAKIAFLRRDIEECAIQGVHRDEENVAYLRQLRVPYMDETYGHDIGTRLWNEVMAKLESYYTEEQAKKSREWWIQCNIPPPPELAEEDDKAKYWKLQEITKTDAIVMVCVSTSI